MGERDRHGAINRAGDGLLPGFGASFRGVVSAGRAGFKR